MAPQCVSLVERVEAFLRDHLADERRRWEQELPAGQELITLAEQYVFSGGKRLRAKFCYLAYCANEGHPDSEEIIRACAALELLHAFALIHDDIMDGAMQRRDKPTPHHVRANVHRNSSWRGESRRYGEGVAILLGDLLFVYAQLLAAELNDQSRELWSRLTSELVMGQYLDIEASAQGIYEQEVSLAIARYKSGKYSVERPLQLGAAVAGKQRVSPDQWSEFGVPLGEAFQFRDDLLGVIGETAVTGKPVGDDIREGKPTLLMTYAIDHANEQDAELLKQVGNQEIDQRDIDRIIDVLHRTGATAFMESEIEHRLDQAERALSAMSIDEEIRNELKQVAEQAVRRVS